MKLNSSAVKDVSRHARPQFGHDGSVFKGLLKMVRDYRFDRSLVVPRRLLYAAVILGFARSHLYIFVVNNEDFSLSVAVVLEVWYRVAIIKV